MYMRHGTYCFNRHFAAAIEATSEACQSLCASAHHASLAYLMRRSAARRLRHPTGTNVFTPPLVGKHRQVRLWQGIRVGLDPMSEPALLTYSGCRGRGGARRAAAGE